MANQPPNSRESPEDKRFSWRHKVTSCSDVFSSFKTDSLHSLKDDYGEMLANLGNEPELNPGELGLTVDTFVKNYRLLPVAVRAKLENWSINIDDVKMMQGDAESETCNATYHGLQVSVSVHKNDQNKDFGHADECLQTEIRAMAQLRHPNIVGFLGVSISSKGCIIVTEFTKFGSLRSFYLGKQVQQPAWHPKNAQALSWALDLAQAVTYLHQMNFWTLVVLGCAWLNACCGA